MSDTNEPLRRLLAQVGQKSDVMVGGTPIQARQLFAEAAAALADRATVVSVASPIGELSLSTLIAQLSGRLDLDEQDDAVLDLGFKRLQGDGQTVLMLLAPAGISRSALRYVQHVARQSPRLALVAHLVPSLASMLEEPGFAALRARLQASPVVEFDAPVQAVAEPVPAVLGPPMPADVVAKPKRRVLWAASALGVAAVTAIVWLAHQAPGTAVAGSRSARIDRPLVPASVPLPLLAGLGSPALAESPTPTPAVTMPPPLATPMMTSIARRPPIALAALPAPSLTLSTPLPLVHPSPVIATLGRPAEATRRDAPRLARARPYWPAPRYREPAEYEAPRAWDGVSPIWARRDRREPSYLGTYAVGPNGIRVFQYDP